AKYFFTPNSVPKSSDSPNTPFGSKFNSRHEKTSPPKSAIYANRLFFICIIFYNGNEACMNYFSPWVIISGVQAAAAQSSRRLAIHADSFVILEFYACTKRVGLIVRIIVQVDRTICATNLPTGTFGIHVFQTRKRQQVITAEINPQILHSG